MQHLFSQQHVIPEGRNNLRPGPPPLPRGRSVLPKGHSIFPQHRKISKRVKNFIEEDSDDENGGGDDGSEGGATGMSQEQYQQAMEAARQRLEAINLEERKLDREYDPDLSSQGLDEATTQEAELDRVLRDEPSTPSPPSPRPSSGPSLVVSGKPADSKMQELSRVKLFPSIYGGPASLSREPSIGSSPSMTPGRPEGGKKLWTQRARILSGKPLVHSSPNYSLDFETPKLELPR